MKRHPFTLGLLLGALLACGLFAYLAQQSSSPSHAISGKSRKIKVAHTLTTDHPVHLGIERFAERLSALSGGRLICQIYPSGQLGKETTYLEKLQSGSLDIAKTSAAPIANFIPRMNVFSFPYLFRDRSHFWKSLDGEVGQELLAKLEDRGEGKPSGFRGLCYFDAGSRNFYTLNPVKSPADLKGLVIRVMEDPIAIQMMQSLNAIPKPMDGGEIYGALQRGNIQGAENNPPTFINQRHFEVCKHFTLDHHSRIPDVLAISSNLWNDLNPQEREWLQTAAAEASRYQRDLWEQQSEAALAEMQRHGVQVHHIQPEAFQSATREVGANLLTPEIASYKSRIHEIK